MKLLIVFAALVCGALCNNNNLEAIIAQVIADTDVNNDGLISETEFKQELLAKWSGNPDATSLSKHDFVTKWTHEYKDNHKDAEAFFNNLDAFPDGVLTDLDLLFHLGTLNPTPNNEIAVADFANFLRKNHPCGSHGHLHCTA